MCQTCCGPLIAGLSRLLTVILNPLKAPALSELLHGVPQDASIRFPSLLSVLGLAQVSA